LFVDAFARLSAGVDVFEACSRLVPPPHADASTATRKSVGT